MELSQRDHCCLADAMELLAAGHWRAFEARMWLSFGDDWTRLRDMLVRHRHLALKGQWKDEPRLTETGATFLERLRAHTRAAAG